jgi:HK97 family phage portal protein
MQVSAFYRGVIYISSQISKLPWNLKDAENKPINDRLSYLISLAPNPEMNSMRFRLLTIQTAIIHGNAYAEIERDVLGRPVALWPIPTSLVEPTRLKDGSLSYKVTSGASGGGDVYLRPMDIFHIPNFHTKDGIVGQGVIAYASDVLGISLGADRLAGNLFSNGGLPSGTLETDAKMSDEAFERLKKSWKESHGGKKTGSVAVLEEGLKFKAISYSPDIMQFLESRKFGVLEISRFLGLPPTKLFDVTAATYSNQEQSNLEVATDTLDAWAKTFEIEADVKLLKGQFGGRKTEMDLYAVFRGDMTTRANYFSKMMQTSSLTPNEIRTKEGLPPYEGGDRFYIATNNFSPVDRIDEIVDAQVKDPEPANDPEPTDPATEEADKNEDELAKAAIDFLKRK